MKESDILKEQINSVLKDMESLTSKKETRQKACQLVGLLGKLEQARRFETNKEQRLLLKGKI